MYWSTKCTCTSSIFGNSTCTGPLNVHVLVPYLEIHWTEIVLLSTHFNEEELSTCRVLSNKHEAFYRNLVIWGLPATRTCNEAIVCSKIYPGDSTNPLFVWTLSIIWNREHNFCWQNKYPFDECMINEDCPFQWYQLWKLHQSLMLGKMNIPIVTCYYKLRA